MNDFTLVFLITAGMVVVMGFLKILQLKAENPVDRHGRALSKRYFNDSRTKTDFRNFKRTGK